VSAGKENAEEREMGEGIGGEHFFRRGYLLESDLKQEKRFITKRRKWGDRGSSLFWGKKRGGKPEMCRGPRLKMKEREGLPRRKATRIFCRRGRGGSGRPLLPPVRRGKKERRKRPKGSDSRSVFGVEPTGYTFISQRDCLTGIGLSRWSEGGGGEKGNEE